MMMIRSLAVDKVRREKPLDFGGGQNGKSTDNINNPVAATLFDDKMTVS
jgi:hypothetical protein